MLIKDFYSIVDIAFINSGFNATVKLNTKHKIYSGHFPEQPVVPGVMQLQIAKELLQEVSQSKLIITKVNQVKYLIPITPDDNPELIFTFNNTIIDNEIKSHFTVSFDDIVFTKAKVIYTVVTTK